MKNLVTLLTPKEKMKTHDNPTTTGEIEARITEYLAAGGLFNPELMEHDKVRDLLMDFRDALAAERKQARAGGWLSQEALDEYAKVEAEHRQLQGQLATALEDAKHYRGLFDEIRQALRGSIPTDATKKQIIDKVKQLREQLAAAVEALKRLKRWFPNSDASKVCDAALAKIGEKQ